MKSNLSVKALLTKSVCAHRKPCELPSGAEVVSFKMLFDPQTGKIFGAQAVGKDGIDKRIDVMAVAQRAGMTVEQLQHLELTYAPPFGSA